MEGSWYRSWWVITLFIIIILFASIKIIGFVFFLYMDEDLSSPTPNQDSDTLWTHSSSSISAPLYLIQPEVTSKGISLEIKNSAYEDLAIKRVFIDSCGEINEEFIFPSNEELTITVPCSLNKGDQFVGVVKIDYISEGSSEVETSSGGVFATVR